MENKEDTKVSEVEPLQIKLPPFWAASPSTWFLQVEAQFVVSRIKKEWSKYNLVVASLPQDIANSILDILQNPPEADQYTELKRILIERHSFSIEKRIRMLISDHEIGDRKPSEFYRFLKNIAGTSDTVSDDLIRKIWQSRLPNLINIALIPHTEEGLEKVLHLADNLFEAMQPSISSIGNPRVSNNEGSNNASVRSSSNNSNDIGVNSFTSGVRSSSSLSDDRYDALRGQISELRMMVAEMVNRNSRTPHSRTPHRTSRYRSRSRSHSRGRQVADTASRLCWYHYRFGDRATKCVSPCARSGAVANQNSNLPTN